MTELRFADQPHGLPPIGFGRAGGRWTAGLKSAVVEAVRVGHVSLEAVIVDYGISADEFLSWQRAHMLAGQRGLRANKGLAEVRPGTRYRTTRKQANARDKIPASAHQRVSLPHLRFLAEDA